MGRPTASDRVTRLAKKLTPRRWVSGFVTANELAQLRADGVPGFVALRPEPMTPEAWSSAVAVHHGEVMTQARQAAAIIRGHSEASTDGATVEPE